MLDIAYFSKQGTNELNGEAILHLYEKNINLFAIAEGVGNHTEKNLAANFSLTIIQKLFKNNCNIDISDIFQSLSLEFKFFSNALKGYKKFKTMLTVCIIKDNIVYIGHIGNSRVYHIIKNKIICKTYDQYNIQQIINHNILNEDILKIGISEQANYQLEELSFPINKNEKILLISDGIYNCINQPNDLLELSLTSNNIKTFAFKIQQVIEFYEINDDYSSICIEVL